jgi:hypothetical protein
LRRNVFFLWIHCYVSDFGNLFTHLTSTQKLTLRLLKLLFYGVDVVEWSRALDVRLSEWCCSVSMVWVQIPSRDFGNLFTHLTSTQKCKSLYCSPTILKDSSCTTLLAVAWIYIYIYIYVWKLNQTVVELDFRAVKFLFFPRRDLTLEIYLHTWHQHKNVNHCIAALLY